MRAKKHILVTKDAFAQMVTGPKGRLAVSKALIHLFNRQTAYEQQAETTHEHNGVGFTGTEGEFGVSCAKHVLAHGLVSQRQYEAWIKPTGRKGYPKIAKYWRQINQEAERARDALNAAKLAA